MHALHAPGSSERTILTVEDSRLMARVIGDVLRESGFTVVKAATGAEACAAMRDVQPNLVLLDLSLPDGDGMDLLPA